LNIDNAVVDVENVNCLAEGGGYNVAIDIKNNPGPVRLSRSLARAEGGAYAIAVKITQQASSRLTDVTATAAGAEEVNRGLEFFHTVGTQPLNINHCRIAGATNSIYNNAPENTLYVGASKLDGPVSTTGNWYCSRCYDGGNMDLNGSCQ
jgi:hypothetical protein